jgi:hypothetical protein
MYNFSLTCVGKEHLIINIDTDTFERKMGHLYKTHVINYDNLYNCIRIYGDNLISVVFEIWISFNQ